MKLSSGYKPLLEKYNNVTAKLHGLSNRCAELSTHKNSKVSTKFVRLRMRKIIFFYFHPKNSTLKSMS